jgi:hypothetical protein
LKSNLISAVFVVLKNKCFRAENLTPCEKGNKEMQLNNSYYPVGVSSFGLDPKSGRMRGTVAKTLLVESVPFPGF